MKSLVATAKAWLQTTDSEGAYKLLNMKKHKRTILIIIFYVILPIIALVLIFTLESKYINSLEEEYVSINTPDEVNGVLYSMKSRKGGAYVTLDNGLKVSFYPSRNYLYKEYFMYQFLHIGDQITKQKGNDTLFVYRNGQEYYFVIGEIVNRK